MKPMTRRTLLLMLGAGLVMTLLACHEVAERPVVPELPDADYGVVPEPLLPPRPALAHPTVGNRTPPTPMNQTPVAGGATYSVLPRSMWTKAGANLAHVVPMDGVTRITFHHSGDQDHGHGKAFLETGLAETAAHLEQVRRFHTEQRGWGDIGYHFAIDRAGRIWQLRSLRYQGAHVKHEDEHNIGIVVLGNFNLQDLTEAQKQTIKSFGHLVRTLYHVQEQRVYVHRELGDTDCPGARLKKYLDQIRRQKLI